MPKVVKRTFSLTEEQAKFIDSKVEDGTYASGSEVVREGLRAAQQREEAVELWLREALVPTLEKVRRGEGKRLTPEQVRENVQREYRRLIKAAE